MTIERGRRSSLSDSTTAEPIDFSSGDKLLSLGASWRPQYIDALEGLASRGVTVVALIYDMIPITLPNFLRREEVELGSKRIWNGR